MIIRADSRLIPLRDSCVQTVVTSPPYWGLRDYGVSGQIGLEPTPEEYVATMVGVFREVRRVLRPDGTVWLNLGDSYGHGATSTRPSSKNGAVGGWQCPANEIQRNGLKAKDLIGIPWRVAFALQADGWYLRSDIIWAKPNPMPESVTDRPTRSHEYLFLLAKSERYFYDADAIREPAEALPRVCGENSRIYQDRDPNHQSERKKGMRRSDMEGYGLTRGTSNPSCSHPNGRNKRDVWTINSEPTPAAHFATFPQTLVEPCILAGSRTGDIVLDPFLGSGTVGRVSERLGRRWVGLELSSEYISIAEKRTAQQGLGL